MQGVLNPEPALVRGFSAEYLREFGVLPLSLTRDWLRIATVIDRDTDEDVLEDLRRSFGRPVELVPVDRSELYEAIRAAFAAGESVRGLVDGLEVRDSVQFPADQQIADARDLASQPLVVRLVNLLIREAFDAGASDIHLESTRSGMRVRARVDGVLTPLPSPPRQLEQAVVSRLKLLAELDIAERRVPQDGRIRIRFETRELDLRVGTVPTQFGESIVLRLLDRSAGPTTLADLGMDSAALKVVENLARRSHGLILATGPTGSGKTTSLYSALTLRSQATEKIITVEDPIEYLLDGITQVPVHPKAGVSFASALRSVLRQDPDVVMVGEMRDRETAAIATQAALTGHLVFSTLHTNDAVSAVVRLRDLGVESFLVAAVLRGVIAQRLVRLLCNDCAVIDVVEPIVAEPRAHLPGRLRPRRAVGCGRCRGTGYRGRIGLFEVLVVDDPLRDAIAARSDSSILQNAARKGGLRPLWDDGRAKAAAGLTSIEEVTRVLGD